MDPKLQKRVQRYGWDLAIDTYEPLWSAQLAVARAALLDAAALSPGERVLDVACGAGLVTFPAARQVGPGGSVVGVDISGRMVEDAARRAEADGIADVSFARMDAEALDLPDGAFDVALCALGLMYMPDPEFAGAEMRRVLRPGGRMVLSTWGERTRCGWAPAFEIVDAEVASEVCPLFFRLGQGEALANRCVDAGFEAIERRRIPTSLDYPDADTSCDAAFRGGPFALAWSRFDEPTRCRARIRYLEAIAAWRREGGGYALPGVFVVVSARVPGLTPMDTKEPIP